jgi:pimeloyl-ACP methyl ester carboxylesterase
MTNADVPEGTARSSRSSIPTWSAGRSSPARVPPVGRHREDHEDRHRGLCQSCVDPARPPPLPLLPSHAGGQARRHGLPGAAQGTHGGSRQELLAGAQLKAIRAAGVQAPHDLGRIRQPVLVANGDNDVMVASEHSADMARRLPDAKLVIYPDSGHGGVFQHHQQFLPEVLEFLER